MIAGTTLDSFNLLYTKTSSQYVGPVPPEIASLVDQAHIVDPPLLQACASDEAGEAAADEGDGDVVPFPLPLDPLRVGILQVVRQLPLHLEVLVVAVGPEALVALLAVLGPEGVPVDRGREVSVGSHGADST